MQREKNGMQAENASDRRNNRRVDCRLRVNGRQANPMCSHRRNRSIPTPLITLNSTQHKRIHFLNQIIIEIG